MCIRDRSISELGLWYTIWLKDFINFSRSASSYFGCAIKGYPVGEILNVSLEILYLIDGIVSPALIEPKTVRIFVFDAGVIKVFMLIPEIFFFLSNCLTAIETIEFFKFSFLETHLSIFLLEI